MFHAFNARFISTFTPDRLYRVYVDRGEIFCIRLAGQGGLAAALAPHFGLLGVFIIRALKKRDAEKLAARVLEMDQQHPSAQISAHKHNFHATAGAIERSSLDPPPAVRTHGEHFGRWTLKLRDGKEMIFQLETFEEMKVACQLLPALGRAHVTNVVYDQLKQKFVKPVAEMAGARS